MDKQLNGPMHLDRYLREAAFAIVLLLVSFQPAFGATKPDDAPTSKTGSGGSGGLGPDVIGLRIGMTPAEARAILKSRGFTTKGETSRTLAFDAGQGLGGPVPNGKFLSIVEAVKPSGQGGTSAVVFFAPVPGQERIVSVNRDELVPNKPSTLDVFEKTLVEKYGTWTYRDKSWFIWSYDGEGTLQRPGFIKERDIGECSVIRRGVDRNSDWVLTTLQNIPHFQQFPARCGAIVLSVDVMASDFGPDALVNRYIVSLAAYDAAIRASKVAGAIIDKAATTAKEAAVKKGQQQKPDF